MSFWNIIKSLDFKQIWVLFLWFLKHPLFMFATVKATFFTMRIAQREFPYIHGKHNKANAFRHALWNLSIANQSKNFSTDLDSILNWTKKITDWHEQFSPNKEMPRLMDLHNNAFGRKKFIEWQQHLPNEFVNMLKYELSKAILVKQKSDFKNYENQLVYLEK
ncbi:DUF6973 domain-containing protein [Polaribacter glomeratus]|uniref:DUF6973 domain-containing protein n=1 Tax=Polaribacter glomeratus TaxID=102 RepID=A0A2S7WXT1_9FLAO|nr:hypothetical protein [Polaribacter glomeratus]PQJ82394.1 hypothetical protein BTO16_07300 [Polaribacter glomeratus]TXD64505.1 hypothetical protein ESX12_14345 [Polaribacter glomeratus]